MPTFPKTADATGFPPLDTGWYRLKVLDVREKTDKNGDEYWAVQFEVIDQEPKQVWQNFRNDEKWLWLLKAFLECINPDLIEKEFDSKEIEGEEVMAFITPDGKYDRIKQFAGKDEPQPTVPSEEKDDDLPF